MKTLADIVLDYYWFLNFCDDEQLDPDTAANLIENVSYQLENELSESEKDGLKKAAAERLKWWFREPDEHGYTPRKLLTTEQKSFLESIATGHFSGPWEEIWS
jgi:hypothetical protein